MTATVHLIGDRAFVDFGHPFTFAINEKASLHFGCGVHITRLEIAMMVRVSTLSHCLLHIMCLPEMFFLRKDKVVETNGFDSKYKHNLLQTIITMFVVGLADALGEHVVLAYIIYTNFYHEQSLRKVNATFRVARLL